MSHESCLRESAVIAVIAVSTAVIAAIAVSTAVIAAIAVIATIAVVATIPCSKSSLHSTPPPATDIRRRILTLAILGANYRANHRPNHRAVGLAIVLAGSLTSCFDWTRDPAGRPEYLVDYIDAHYRDLGRRFVQPLSRAGFRSRLTNARVLFLGDHHRDPGLHHEILALIDWLSDEGFRPVLGVESIGIQDNPVLQEYLAGGIELQQLRQYVGRRWPASWLDSLEVDRSFYRHLLSTARTKAIPMFALEPTPRHRLSERDTLIATNIRRALQLHPDRLIVVIVGHAHLLGNGHLTGRVGVPSLAVAARFSERLGQLAQRHPRVPPTSFVQTERGVLFFASALPELDPPPR